MTSERLFNSFIHPQNFYTPKKQISGYAPGQKLVSWGYQMVNISDPVVLSLC